LLLQLLLVIHRLFLHRRLNNGLVLAEGSLPAQDYAAMLGEGLLDLTGFARPFIANPDFLTRLREGLPMSKTDPETVYSPGPEGYTDYPFWDAADPDGSVVGADAPEDEHVMLKAQAVA